MMGGLGNQFFQYAFAKRIKEQFGYDVELELSWYKSFNEETTPRTFLLNYFNCDMKITDPLNSQRCSHVINEIPGEIALIQDDTYYIGYWQNPYYFKEISKIIKDDIKIKDHVLNEEALNIEKGIVSCNSVSLHIRRTDYLNCDDYPICGIEFYKEAVRRMIREHGECIFYIFSDDLQWARDNLSFIKNRVFVDSGDDVADWYLMSKTKHHIIANSTYSWWAAWIGYYSGTVIMPRLWLYSDNHNELRCDGWVVI